MANRKTESKDGNMGCMLIAVIVFLGIAGAIVYGGISLIASEPNAMCGSVILEEGETCSTVSRSSGDEIDTFDAEGARRGDNFGRDFIGGLLVLVGGVVAVPGVIILYHGVYPRMSPKKGGN